LAKAALLAESKIGELTHRDSGDAGDEKPGSAEAA
jgi:hypothetical protein